MRQVFPHARGHWQRTLTWPTVFDVGTSPRLRRLLGTHHTYEQRLAALSQLSYSPSGFPRTPVASPTDTTSCLAAAPWVRGVSATTRAYRPPAGLGHPAPERIRSCAHSPALREASRGLPLPPPQHSFLRKCVAKRARNSHTTSMKLTNISPMRVAQRFCIAPISERTARAELHLAHHWIETTDYSHPRASDTKGRTRSENVSQTA